MGLRVLPKRRTKKDPGSYQDGGCPGNDKEIQQKSKLQGFGFIIETTTGKAARFPCGMGVSLGSRRMASRRRGHDLVAPIGLAKWLARRLQERNLPWPAMHATRARGKRNGYLWKRGSRTGVETADVAWKYFCGRNSKPKRPTGGSYQVILQPGIP